MVCLMVRVIREAGQTRTGLVGGEMKVEGREAYHGDL
jgi:hypothetical protein